MEYVNIVNDGNGLESPFSNFYGAKTNNIFALDVTFSCNDPVVAYARMSPELQLLRAILADAIECYLYITRKGKFTEDAEKRFEEAKKWIESDEEEWLCSFINICRIFSIEPEYLRSGLQNRISQTVGK